MDTKLAILGASYLQKSLVLKAKDMGLETHVFAWEEGNIVSDICDHFYNISILEKERILEICRKVGIHGITTIATDIAMPVVNCIANELALVGNSLLASKISTDKFDMRTALQKQGVPNPRFLLFTSPNFNGKEELTFPVIVKPTDRSGSRGVTKVLNPEELNKAIGKALKHSIKGRVIVEEFINGDQEFSVECISFNGVHYPIVVTEKVTSGEPYYLELEHHQPAQIDDEIKEKLFKMTITILNALKIENGASHTEMYLLKNGELRVVESAGRMGGDCIGSHLVPLSTGFDYLQATIEVALGRFDIDRYKMKSKHPFSGVYFIIPNSGTIEEIEDSSSHYKEVVYSHAIKSKGELCSGTLDGSDKRAGILVYSSDKRNPLVNPSEILKFRMKSE